MFIIFYCILYWGHFENLYHYKNISSIFSMFIYPIARNHLDGYYYSIYKKRTVFIYNFLSIYEAWRGRDKTLK